METTKILSADLLDILFEGRNKSYGAYDLRKTYDRRIKYSLAGTFFLCLILVVGSILANGKNKNTSQQMATDVIIEAFVEPPKDIPKPPLPKIEPPKVEMTTFTPPKIVEDDKVKPQDEIKEVDELAETKIGSINQEGIKGDDVIAPPVEASTGVVQAPKVEDDIDKIFITVQKQAQFPGGIAEWNKFLERYLNRDLPSENGAPAADYTVVVSFIVDRDGNISDVKAENDPGYGTKNEAIRVIKKAPKWIPAEQNGHSVIYRQKQNITFRVSEN